jgi:hypothetical protein
MPQFLHCPHQHAGASPASHPALEPGGPACQKPSAKRGQALKTKRTLTDGQRAYEARRAAKAGMSLDKWLDSKQRQQEADARAKGKALEPAKPVKKPGLFSRLMERAQRPFGS